MNNRATLYLALPFVLLIGILAWLAKEILLYLIISAILALVGRPLMRLLGKIQIRQIRLPRSVQAVVTLITMVAVAVVLFTLFIPVIVEQTQNLEKINVEAIAQSLEEPIAALEARAQKYQLTEGNMSMVEYFQTKVRSVLSLGKLSNLVNAVIGATGDFFIAFFSILFITFFFLKEEGMMADVILMITPNGYEERVKKVLDSVRSLLTRYFIGVMTEVFLVGGLISIGLMLLGIKNAVIIGFFAGIFNVIPYLGPIIGALMGISLTILSSLQLDFYSEMVPLILKVGVIFIVVQLIDNFVFQPYIYSSSVKAHPLEIFLVILLAGSLAGVGGMILAIPTYTILRVMAKEFFNQFKVVRTLTKSI